jgi:hypothetical protein
MLMLLVAVVALPMLVSHSTVHHLIALFVARGLEQNPRSHDVSTFIES